MKIVNDYFKVSDDAEFELISEKLLRIYKGTAWAWNGGRAYALKGGTAVALKGGRAEAWKGGVAYARSGGKAVAWKGGKAFKFDEFLREYKQIN